MSWCGAEKATATASRSHMYDFPVKLTHRRWQQVRVHVNFKLTNFILINSDDKRECNTSFLNDGEMLVFQILFYFMRVLCTTSNDMCTQQLPQTLDMIVPRATTLSNIPKIIVSVHQINKFCLSNSFTHILRTIIFFHNFNRNTISTEMKLSQ